MPNANLLLISILSLFFIAIYSYQGIYEGSVPRRKTVFIIRILINYIITCIVVAIVLLSLNRLPLLSDTLLAIKRIIIVAFPASMGAVVVDGLDKEWIYLGVTINKYNFRYKLEK